MFGCDVRESIARQRIGYLPEHPDLYRFLTGCELLRFAGRLAGCRELPQEENRGTVYMLLAKPVSRLELLVGKWLGAWSGAVTAVLLLYLATALLAAARGAVFSVAVLVQAWLLHAVALAILAALGLAVSTRLNRDASNPDRLRAGLHSGAAAGCLAGLPAETIRPGRSDGVTACDNTDYTLMSVYWLKVAGRDELAMRALRDALGRHPRAPELHLERARLLLRSGDSAGAARALDAGLACTSGGLDGSTNVVRGMLCTYRSLIYEYDGDTNAAIACLSDGNKQSPDVVRRLDELRSNRPSPVPAAVVLSNLVHVVYHCDDHEGAHEEADEAAEHGRLQ